MFALKKVPHATVTGIRAKVYVSCPTRIGPFTRLARTAAAALCRQRLPDPQKRYYSSNTSPSVLHNSMREVSLSDLYDNPEFQLLGQDPLDVQSTDTTHAFRTAPIVTGDAFRALGASVFPQRAVYGRIVSQQAPGFAVRPDLPVTYINTNAPFSALVCGVQGSGKSHSTSVLLESCLISDPRLGTLPAPLSAIVFHFDTTAGGGVVQPCEAAYLSTLDAERGLDATPPPVTVLVLPSNVNAMRRVYAGLPNVKVEPLHFAVEDISGERLLAMMKVDENTQMPIYMETIMAILRSMENNFDYERFRNKLKQQKYNPSQKAMLDLRLSLLDSCLQGGTATNRVSSHFKEGQLTIIDLSSPFMDASSACGFFDMILGLFVEADIGTTGKLIVLDEAHKVGDILSGAFRSADIFPKYLSESQAGTSARLTESLLTIIRQQRHLATRVVISTQEPTVVPSKYLDLCSFVIAHRFSSPKWLRLLTEHVSAAEDSLDELFMKIVSLGTGQAILFAPNGLGMRSNEGPTAQFDQFDPSSEAARTDSDTDGQIPAAIGQGYLHVQSRLRVTRDGGHSILAVPDAGATRLGRVSGRSQVTDVHGSMEHSIGRTSSLSGLVTAEATNTSPFHATVKKEAGGSDLDVHEPPYTPVSSLPAPFPIQTSTPTPLRPIEIAALIDYLTWGREQLGIVEVSMNYVIEELRRRFPTSSVEELRGIVLSAAQDGLVLVSSNELGEWVMLVPQARTAPAEDTRLSESRVQGTSAILPGRYNSDIPSAASDFHASSHTTPVPRVITCTGEHSHFLPLVKFVLAAHMDPGQDTTRGIKISLVQKHFKQVSPGRYGTKLKLYRRAVSEAIAAGLLADAKETGQELSRVTLVPGAQYSL